MLRNMDQRDKALALLSVVAFAYSAGHWLPLGIAGLPGLGLELAGVALVAALLWRRERRAREARRRLTAEMKSRDRQHAEEILRLRGAGREELEHAYAVTIHKSQGSEYPAVVIPLLSGPKMLMTRNLLYTAVTRARKCVTLVGDEQTFEQMIANTIERRRYTTLAERIRELTELQKNELERNEAGPENV